MGSDSVCSQSGGRVRDVSLRCHGGRRLLSAAGGTPRPGAFVSATGHGRGARAVVLVAFPTGDCASEDRRALPGTGARRDGSEVRNRANGQNYVDRPTKCERATSRQPHHRSWHAEFSRLWDLSQGRARIVSSPGATTVCLARYDRDRNRRLAIWTGLVVQGERRAFLGSCTVIAGLLAATAVGVFPVVLQSTLAPEYSLTVYNSATAERGLMVALIWWPVALVLALTYFVVIMRNYSGKVRASEDTRGSY
jgi:hypothetical protein